MILETVKLILPVAPPSVSISTVFAPDDMHPTIRLLTMAVWLDAATKRANTSHVPSGKYIIFTFCQVLAATVNVVLSVLVDAIVPIFSKASFNELNQ